MLCLLGRQMRKHCGTTVETSPYSESKAPEASQEASQGVQAPAFQELHLILTAMASDPFRSWANRTVLRMGREEPYLSIQDIVVFVRDLEVSKRFYVDLLGFELITEQCLPTGVR
jgi:hypothetical protein